MFSKILDIFKNNKKIIFLSMVFISLYFMLWDISFAADDNAKFFNDNWTLTTDSAQTINTVLTFISTTITIFLALITYLATLFLSPEWYTGNIFWLNSVFKDVWILVSNMVYLIFAFILIWIAFMNIIWRWWEKYELKKALPKLAVGILIVPFSWFFVNFILSIAWILSISALNLPYNVFPDYDTKMSSVYIPSECDLTLSLNNTSSWFLNCKGVGDDWVINDGNWVAVSTLLNGSAGSSIFSVFSVYTYNVIWLPNLSKLPKAVWTDSDSTKSDTILSDQWVIKTIWDIVIKVFFDFIFIILFSILMIALWLVLLVRWIYLWMYIMLSPLFGLMYFFDKSEWWSWFFEKFNIKHFLWLAMVPVYTMLALSFSLLLIFLLWTAIEKGIKPEAIQDDFINFSNSWIIIWAPNQEKNQVKLNITWPLVDTKSLSNFVWFLWDTKTEWLWIIGWLILKIFWVVLLWWSVMAALRSSEITKEIVEPLNAFGWQVWGMLKTAPQYAPIFWGQSMKSMQQIWNTASSYYWQKANAKWTDLLDKYWLFWQSAKTELNSSDALEKLRSLNRESVTAFSKAYHWYENTADAASSSKMVEATQKLAEHLWIPKNEYENIKLNKNNFAKVIAEIDFKLDWIHGWKYWDLLKHRNNFKNSGEFNWAASDDYLKSVKDWDIDTSTPRNNSSIESNFTDSVSPSIKVWTSNIIFKMKWDKITEGNNFIDNTYRNIAQAVLLDENIKSQFDTNFSDDLKNKIKVYIHDWVLTSEPEWNWKFKSED